MAGIPHSGPEILKIQQVLESGGDGSHAGEIGDSNSKSLLQGLFKKPLDKKPTV